MYYSLTVEEASKMVRSKRQPPIVIESDDDGECGNITSSGYKEDDSGAFDVQSTNA